MDGGEEEYEKGEGGKKKNPKVRSQPLGWWSHGDGMVAPNYPHCPTPSGHGCQSDIPKSGGRERPQ